MPDDQKQDQAAKGAKPNKPDRDKEQNSYTVQTSNTLVIMLDACGDVIIRTSALHTSDDQKPHLFTRGSKLRC